LTEVFADKYQREKLSCARVDCPESAATLYIHKNSMATVHKFGPAPISCHSWSGDRKRLAVSENNTEVNIYQQDSSSSASTTWMKETVLNQHDLRVTGIDWAPKTNRIVTCSSDRNAYVWVKTADGSWKHTLVVLRINRAATCVRWSPDENKFAVGSGAKIVNVCYYDNEYDWWVGKHIKKPLKSTVTTIDWHPNNVLLAVGSTDFKVHIFSGYIKDIEPKPSATEWGAKMTFGNIMAEFSNSSQGGGWVHSVAFNADGSKVAWVAHDSSISVANAAAADGTRVAKLRTNMLPFVSVVWVSPSMLVAAGHNYLPVSFVLGSDGHLAMGRKLEQQEEGKKSTTGAMSKAMKMFQNMDVRGSSSSGGDTEFNTIHENQINELRVHKGEVDLVTSLSSVGADGKLAVWRLNNLTS